MDLEPLRRNHGLNLSRPAAARSRCCPNSGEFLRGAGTNAGNIAEGRFSVVVLLADGDGSYAKRAFVREFC